MKNIYLIGILMSFMALGCDSGSRSKASPNNLQLEITDAPYPFEAIAQANIVISGISVIGSDDGVTPVDSETRVYDLVQLQHGQTAIMTSLNLAPGDYTEFRLIVDTATVTLTDGRSFSLKVPSGSSSGLKVKLDTPLTIVNGLSQRLVFDFDLSQSFAAIPNSAKKAEDITGFRFHPVVRGIVAADTGEVAGSVLAADGLPATDITLTIENQAGDFTQTLPAQEDGSFVFSFLPPDLYTVTAETLDGLTVVSAPLQVVIGNRTTVTLQF
jgi:hypothetical protein